MPNIANMNIGIGANLGRLDKGLNQAQRKITSFASGIDKTLGGKLGSGLANINTQAVPLASNLSNATSAASGMNNQMGNMSNVIGQVGFAIQDAPFAILTGNFASIGNNLPMIIQGMQRMGNETTTMSQKLMMLGKNAFKGPLGIITVANLATAALTLLPMLFKESGEEAEEAEGKISDYVDTIKELRGITQGDFGIAAGLEQEISNTQQAIKYAKQLNDLREEQGDLETELGKFGLNEAQSKRLALLPKLISKKENQIRLLEKETTEVSKLEKQLESLQQQQEALSLATGNATVNLGAYVDRLEGEANRAIANYEAGLEGSEAAIRSQMQALKTVINTYRAAADAGRTELVPAINALQDAYDEMNDTLPEAKKNLEAPDVWQDWAKIPIPINKTADALERIASMPDIDEKLTIKPAKGSIAQLEMMVQAFRNMRRLLPRTSDGFEKLTNAIDETQAKINETKNAGNKMTSDVKTGVKMMTAGFGTLVGQIIRGKKEALSFGNIVSAILPGLLQVLFPGGGLGFNFLSGIFGGLFARGGRLAPGELGIVGEEGPEPIMATPSGAVIAPNSNLGNTGRVMGGSGSVSKTINVPVYLNGRQIALAQGEYNDKINR